MPKLDAAERRDRKIEKRRSEMKLHGKTSLDLIKQEIEKRAVRAKRQQERMEREQYDESRD